jgi:hypothetical protein
MGWASGGEGEGEVVGACRPLARCCCCNSLRFGALLAAWYYFVVAVATIIVTVIGTRHRIATSTSAVFFLGNIGVQALAHLVGFAGVYRRSHWACRRYFHFWVLMVVWVPLDAAWYCLAIWHDMNYYHRTYLDSLWMQVEQAVAVAKLVCAAFAIYAMLVLWSYHENLDSGEVARNDVGECIGRRPPKQSEVHDLAQGAGVSIGDDDEFMEMEQTSLEWLQETDPAATKLRRKVGF